MKKPVACAAIGLGCWFVSVGVAWGQRGVDWTTIGNDAQRSSWIRSDAKISVESVHQPDFRLAWKIKLNNEPRQLNALTPPALFDYYIGYHGFRSFAFVGGSSDRVFAIDTDLHRMEWETSLHGAPPREASLDCPGGMTANLTPADSRRPAAVVRARWVRPPQSRRQRRWRTRRRCDHIGRHRPEQLSPATGAELFPRAAAG